MTPYEPKRQQGFSHPHSGAATYFPPPGRDTDEELGRRIALVRSVPLLQATLDAMPGMVMILNEHRQAIAVNRALLSLLRAKAEDVLGKRPGEMIHCAYCQGGPDGCGSGQHCLTCGAAGAILQSQQSRGTAVEECRVTFAAAPATAMDLRVTATAVEIGGQRLTICAMEDVGDQKRLTVLTRMFFHDVLNTAVGIRSYVSVLAKKAAQGSLDQGNLERLATFVDQLIDEIKAQQDLTLAESGNLLVHPRPVRTSALVEQLRALYASRAVGAERHLRCEDVWDGQILTDARLLRRVLGNMLINALEATQPGGTVTLRCAERGEHVAFSVHNAAVMPEHVQLQVFQRSFTTKHESGRGIGTHSMKLFGERCLGGQVAFTSREPEGTIFTVTIPKVLAAPAVGVV